MSDPLRSSILRIAQVLPTGDPTRRKLIAAAAGKTADWFQQLLEEPLPEPTREQRRETLKETLSRAYGLLAGNLGSRNAFPASFKSTLGAWGKHHGEQTGKLYTWTYMFITDPAKYQDILDPKDIIGMWFSTKIGPGGRVYPGWGTMTTGGMQSLSRNENDSGYRVAEEMKRYLKRL